MQGPAGDDERIRRVRSDEDRRTRRDRLAGERELDLERAVRGRVVGLGPGALATRDAFGPHLLCGGRGERDLGRLGDSGVIEAREALEDNEGRVEPHAAVSELSRKPARGRPGRIRRGLSFVALPPPDSRALLVEDAHRDLQLRRDDVGVRDARVFEPGDARVDRLGRARRREVTGRGDAVVARPRDDLAHQLGADAGVDLDLVDLARELIDRVPPVAFFADDEAHRGGPDGRRAVDQRTADAQSRPDPLAGERARTQRAQVVENAARVAGRCDAGVQIQAAVMIRLASDVNVGVDETGKHGHAACVDRARDRAAVEHAGRRDLHDAVALDEQVGGMRFRARAVEERSASDERPAQRSTAPLRHVRAFSHHYHRERRG